MQYSKALLASSLLTAFTLTTSMAYAEYKVATLDVAKVLEASKEAQEAKKKLEATSKEAKATIESKRAAIKPLQDKLRSGTLDPKSEEAAKLRKASAELLELMKQEESKLQKEFSDMNKSISEKIAKSVASYSTEHKINLVLDKGESSRTGVIFAEKTFDITADIISDINN